MKQRRKGWEGREDEVLMVGICLTAAGIVASVAGAGPSVCVIGLFLVGCGIVLRRGAARKARESEEA